MVKRLILGAPGTGKTTQLLDLMEDALSRGVQPDRIAFVSFTRAAVGEARERARVKFGFTEDDLPWFRTLHSLAFRALGVRRSEICSQRFYGDLEEVTGESGLRKGADPLTEPVVFNGAATGSHLLGLEQAARARCVGLVDVWHQHGGSVEWHRLERFQAAYTAMRLSADMMDFTDLLERYVSDGGLVPDVEIAIVDEAQDLSRLQWRVVSYAFASAPLLVVAGDPNQAVHRWAGADPYWLQQLEHIGDKLPPDIKKLTVSHRLPEVIFQHARTLAARTEEANVYGTAVHGRSGGTVEWVADASEVDLGTGTWLLMARGGYQLEQLENVARDQGVYYERGGKPSVDPGLLRAVRAYETMRGGKPISSNDANLVATALGLKGSWDDEELVERASFSRAHKVTFDRIWHDAFTTVPIEDIEYMLAVLRRGEKFTGRPRVRLSTMHGAKGQEAEGAVVLTDLPPRAYHGLELDPAAEARVFYVAVTRASETLRLVAPRTPYPYHL